MKLREALSIIQSQSASNAKLNAFLAVGFEPLHLKTFFAASLHQALRDRRINVETGVFGDLVENIERMSRASRDVQAIVIEWADLDPRFSPRRLGGWSKSTTADLIESSGSRLDAIVAAIAVSASVPTGVILPTLPLPPIFHTAKERAAHEELALHSIVADAALQLTQIRNVRVASGNHFESLRAAEERGDVSSDLATGFPYSLPHAADLAQALAALVAPPPPRKGLITDLDDTMWRGILGEDGLEGITWSMEAHSHIHALYQQMLNAIAESGALVAVASRNDESLVKQALARTDCILESRHVFPVHANWGPKSDSVRSILETWNINPADVVFVDDSPLELAEVAAAFPEIQCVRFDGRDVSSAYQTIKQIRQLFAKEHVTAEDSLRAQSIRAAAEFPPSNGSAREDVLASLGQRMTIVELRDKNDSRPLELINKTNQFNLNGRRLTESEFDALTARENNIYMVVSYEDRFGPLGKIGALVGFIENGVATISSWVLSCRAFGRRIEHAMLAHVFQSTGAGEVVLEFSQTERNTPMREFLESLGLTPVGSSVRLRRDQYEKLAPATYFSSAS